MVELPSIFNIADFFGTILPGYVAVTLYLVLFHRDLLLAQSANFSFDLFTSVVFIIAGPTIGLALKQFHRYIHVMLNVAYFAIKGRIYRRRRREMQNRGPSDEEEFEDYNTVSQLYAKTRIKASVEEKLELDKAEAHFDFGISTAIAVLVIGIYYWHNQGGFIDYVHVPIFIFSGILFVGGIFEYKYSVEPMALKLMEEKKVIPSAEEERDV